MHDLLISAINLKEAPPLLALTLSGCKREDGRGKKRKEEREERKGSASTRLSTRDSGPHSILTGKKSCPPETRFKQKSTFIWQCHREGILATNGKDRIPSVANCINDSSGNHCVLTFRLTASAGVHFGLVAQSVSLPMNYARGRLLRKCQKKSTCLRSSLIANEVTGAAVGRGKRASSPGLHARWPLQKRREMQDAFGSSQPPFRIWRRTSSSSSDYFIHLGRSPPAAFRQRKLRISPDHAFPITVAESSIFAFGRCRPKISPRALEESHAFTPPPTRQISDFSR